MPSVVSDEQRHVRVRARARDVVVAAVAPAHAGLVGAVRARRDVRLGADDRLDAGVGRLLPEVVGAEDVAVVGDGDRPACPARAASWMSGPTRAAPSSIEYSLCTCRWTKESAATGLLIGVLRVVPGVFESTATDHVERPARVASVVARSTSSACARSAGYSDSNVVHSPVPGCAKRELAWRAATAG